MILLLLGILFFALYRYQEQLISYTGSESDQKKPKQIKHKPILKSASNQTKTSNDDITIDNVSQFSIKSDDNSLMDTGLSFLETNSNLSGDDDQFFRN